MSLEQDTDDEDDYLERHEAITVSTPIRVRLPNESAFSATGTVLDVVIEGEDYTIPVMDARVGTDNHVNVPARTARRYPIEVGDKVAVVVDEVVDRE